MKALIVDDHPLVRDGVRYSLARLDPDVIIIESGSFTAALDVLANNNDLDLIVLDLSMPDLESFDGLRQVTERAGEVPVVVFSGSEDRGDIREAIHCGARGFIPKSSANPVLIAALKLVLSGGTYIPPDLLDDTPQAAKPRAGDSNLLTRRQLEVIGLIARGMTNKEIGRELGLSPGTVRSHLAAIFDALNVSNRTEASHVARSLGILE